MKKKKLELKKKVIASLSDVQKAKIIGGSDDAYTTSNSDCTHFICCGDTCSENPTNCDDSCVTCNETCDTCTCESCFACPSDATCATECPDHTCMTQCC